MRSPFGRGGVFRTGKGVVIEIEQATGGEVPTEGGCPAETGIAEADAQFGLKAEALEGGGEGVD